MAHVAQAPEPYFFGHLPANITPMAHVAHLNPTFIYITKKFTVKNFLLQNCINLHVVKNQRALKFAHT
nr:MAG TPA: hypothetical protein [Caudoviricetes sp.]